MNPILIKNKHNRCSGFTLLELSVSLAIIAFIIGGGISLAMLQLDRAPYKETREKLATIEKALLDYRRAFHRLPCPSNGQLAVDAAGFGNEAANPGTCTVVANGMWSDGASTTVTGTVPTKALGLPDEYAVDGWNRRFTYAVDRMFTENGAFGTYLITDSTVGAMTVYANAATIRTDKALYVIISHGKNGHGAFVNSGGTTHFNADITNVAELENCECNNLAATASFAADKFFYQLDLDEYGGASPPFTGYDDIVVYKTRPQLRAANE